MLREWEMDPRLWFSWDSESSQMLLPLSHLDPCAEERKTSYIAALPNSNWFSPLSELEWKDEKWICFLLMRNISMGK